MKKLLLVALLSVAGLVNAKPEGSKQEQLFLKFYSKYYPKVQTEYLREIIRDVEKYDAKLGIPQVTDVFLCIGHRESCDFNPYEDDHLPNGRHSIGFFQTREQYIPDLRGFWEERGITLGPNDSVDSQCALGVAEFYLKLHDSNGNLWGAVRRYNGGGPKARQYATNVMISRKAIFHHPYVEGERIVFGFNGERFDHRKAYKTRLRK